MNTLAFILVLIIIYLIAAIPTGVVLSRLMGSEDVRQAGSGNIGATNVYRVAGKLAGVLTLVGDILKGFLPLLAFRSWMSPTPTHRNAWIKSWQPSKPRRANVPWRKIVSISFPASDKERALEKLIPWCLNNTGIGSSV